MKIKVIVNPKSGRRVAQKHLEIIIGRMLMEGLATDIHVATTNATGDAQKAAQALEGCSYDLIIGCGGDGTINEIIHGMMTANIHIPLAILAAGTSNDFAYSMNLPNEPEDFCRMVKDSLYQDIDIGRANEHYFINVASFGMFTNVAHSTEQNVKGVLGMLAYYLKGVSIVPEQLMKNIPLIVDSPDYQGDGDFYLCIVSNSMSVGGMRRLMSKASTSDGKLDVLLMKKPNPRQTLTDMFNSLSLGELPLNKDPMLKYFQTDHICFNSSINEEVELDLDGEMCGYLPLTVSVCPKAVKLLIPKQTSLLAPWQD